MSATALTENCALTFSTAGDERVDFFFHVTEDTMKEKTIDLLAKSWNKEPLDTLKLIGFLRDCRNGKGIRRQYQICLLWLFDNHFETLVNNLETLVSFGYWKDVLHLLIILLFDQFIPDYLAIDDCSERVPKVKRAKRTYAKGQLPHYDLVVLKADKKKVSDRLRQMRRNAKKIKVSDEMGDNVMENEAEESNSGLPSVPTREESLIASRKSFAKERYDSDDNYRRLFHKIVGLFAQQLSSDLKIMAKKKASISLAGKWAPTYGNHFDKYLDISDAIAKQLWELTEKKGLIEDKELLYDFYQRQVCAPLRAYLEIPEVYMSAQQWSVLDYNRVASKCMKKNKELFEKYDKRRLEEYLARKKTISGAVLKPIELLKEAHRFIGDEQGHELAIQVNEKQWLSLVENIKKKGGCLLSNAIAVCDVSGSMRGTPMSAARALTLLIMSLSAEPWNSLCITFSESPEFHFVDPNSTFIEKVKSVNENNMKWGYNTNIDKVFDVILAKAVEQRLTAEQMPRLLFIFTDMEFDQASPNTSLTNYESAKQKFAYHNLQLPTIVFWNLKGNSDRNSTPIQMNECGTGLMSGYSGQQVSLILKTKDLDKLDPFNLMRAAIDDYRYSKLQIYD